MIADLKEKRTLTADQKSLLANQEAERTQHGKNEALERELSLRDLIDRKLEEQAREEQRFAERAAQIQEEIAAARESRNQNYSGRLGAFGLGSAKQQEVADQSGIYVEFQRRQAQLLKATPKWMLGSDEYITESMKIKDGLDQALADHANYYESLREMQGNWLYGYSQAVQNYIDETNDLAKQTEKIVYNMFKGLEDYLVDFVMAGEMKFRDFAEAILADLVRISVQGLFTGPLAKMLAAADGEVLGSSGRVTAFAGGGIVSQPTMFNYSGGTGVMGEAGYEAVMPVARGADGKLGVKVTGSQAGPTIIQHVTVGSGVSYGDVMSAMTVAKESAKREIMESMRRGGAFA
jgi:lambda family phage tail tape measure protein